MAVEHDGFTGGKKGPPYQAALRQFLEMRATMCWVKGSWLLRFGVSGILAQWFSFYISYGDISKHIHMSICIYIYTHVHIYMFIYVVNVYTHMYIVLHMCIRKSCIPLIPVRSPQMRCRGLGFKIKDPAF